MHQQFGLVAQIVFEFGIVNVFLAVFNLIPIPPLDGSALIERMLPVSALPTYYQLRMGFIVLVLFFVVFAAGPALEHLQQLRDLVPEHLPVSRPGLLGSEQPDRPARPRQGLRGDGARLAGAFFEQPRDVLGIGRDLAVTQPDRGEHLDEQLG